MRIRFPTSVIDELMYHPIDPNEEYIELYNPLNQKIDLGGARSRGVSTGPWTSTSPPGRRSPRAVGWWSSASIPAVETSRLIAFLVAYKTVRWRRT